MDSEYLWIAVVLVYFLFQILGRKRKPAPPPKKAGPKPSAPPRNAELDDALRDIRRALGWPEEERAPVDVQEAPRQPSTPFEARRRVPATPVIPAAPVMPASSKTRRQDQKQKPIPAPMIVSRLHDMRTLREAIVIKEILDRPLALRRRRR